jgi:GxxExxY protein
MDLNGVTEQVIGAAIAVHRALGPGLLESTYETGLMHELTERGLRVGRQLTLPLVYKGVGIDRGYRIDLPVEGEVVVELEALAQDSPISAPSAVSASSLADHQNPR